MTFQKIIAASAVAVGLAWCAEAQMVYPAKAKQPVEKDCFMDHDRNHICDRSKKAGGDCKENCTDELKEKKAKKDKKKKKKKSELSPCNGCPGGNCGKCLAFLLQLQDYSA